jgi:hypothetical protein
MLSKVIINDGTNYLTLVGDVTIVNGMIHLVCKEGKFEFGMKEVDVTPLTSAPKIRGPRAESKMTQAKRIYDSFVQSGKPILRYQVLAKYKQELGLSGATASTYYQTISATHKK